MGWLAAVLLFGASPGVHPAEAAATPLIAIIIDDMGNQRALGRDALALPGPVTYAFLPFTPHAAPLAREARTKRKEIMLHLPMASHPGMPLGPAALDLHMTEREFKSTLEAALESLPDVRGVNNHMGSLLTRHPGAMRWVMETLQSSEGLYFVDSRTTVATVAEQVAKEHRLPSGRRDVFLDNARHPEMIRAQFARLVNRARKNGTAIGIGHPYPETIAVLRDQLTHLDRRGVRLVSVSRLLELQEKREWQEPSSPSLKVVKNSKQ